MKSIYYLIFILLYRIGDVVAADGVHSVGVRVLFNRGIMAEDGCSDEEKETVRQMLESVSVNRQI